MTRLDTQGEKERQSDGQTGVIRDTKNLQASRDSGRAPRGCGERKASVDWLLGAYPLKRKMTHKHPFLAERGPLQRLLISARFSINFCLFRIIFVVYTWRCLLLSSINPLGPRLVVPASTPLSSKDADNRNQPGPVWRLCCLEPRALAGPWTPSDMGFHTAIARLSETLEPLLAYASSGPSLSLHAATSPPSHLPFSRSTLPARTPRARFSPSLSVSGICWAQTAFRTNTTLCGT